MYPTCTGISGKRQISRSFDSCELLAMRRRLDNRHDYGGVQTRLCTTAGERKKGSSEIIRRNAKVKAYTREQNAVHCFPNENAGNAGSMQFAGYENS